MTSPFRRPQRQSLAECHVALRPATGDDAPQLRRWRAEASVRRFQPLRDVSTAQLRSDLSSQRVSDLFRGRGDRFSVSAVLLWSNTHTMQLSISRHYLA